MTVLEHEEALRNGIVPSDYSDPVATDWPDLLEIVERRAKPQRLKQNDKIGQQIWWRFLRRRDRLYTTIAPLRRVLVTTRHAPNWAPAWIQAKVIFAESLVAFASEDHAFFSVLQSRIHEIWARFFSSSMKDDLRYTPSKCFRTFPFPESFETDASLEAVGEAYHTFRAELMIDRDEGLTKIYNRFHARGENASDIVRLRELHAGLDRAVLRAYGWSDLADNAAPVFIDQEADEGKKPKTRLDWLAEFKDEVLAKLLALNAKRAASERTAGVSSIPEDEDEEVDEEFDA